MQFNPSGIWLNSLLNLRKLLRFECDPHASTGRPTTNPSPYDLHTDTQSLCKGKIVRSWVVWGKTWVFGPLVLFYAGSPEFIPTRTTCQGDMGSVDQFFTILAKKKELGLWSLEDCSDRSKNSRNGKSIKFLIDMDIQFFSNSQK